MTGGLASAALTEEQQAVYDAVMAELNQKADDNKIHYLAIGPDNEKNLAKEGNYNNDGVEQHWGIAIGVNASSKDGDGIALGVDSRAHGNSSTGLGSLSSAVGDYSTATGHDSQAFGDSASAFGALARAYGANGVAIGGGALVANSKALTKAEYDALSEEEKALYHTEKTRQDEFYQYKQKNDSGEIKDIEVNGVAVGNFAKSIGYGGVSVGNFAKSMGKGGVAIGDHAKASDQDNVNNSTWGVALGAYSQNKVSQGVAIGTLSVADREKGAMGYLPTTGTVAADLEEAMQAAGKAEVFKQFKTDYEAANAKLNEAKAAYEADPTNDTLKAAFEEAKKKADDLTDQYAVMTAPWKSQKGAVSVGNDKTGFTRQITGVAAGSEDTDAVNVAQLKVVNAKVDQNKTDITEINKKITNLGESSDWTLAVARGDDSKTENEATVEGNSTKVSGGTVTLKAGRGIKLKQDGTNVQIGLKYIDMEPAGGTFNDAKATAGGALAVGQNSVADGHQGTAVGFETHAGDYAFAGGSYANAKGNGSVGIGYNAIADGESAVAIGSGRRIDEDDPGSAYRKVESDNATAVGSEAVIDNLSEQSTALGVRAEVVESVASAALGSFAKVQNSDYSTAVGNGALVRNSRFGTALGNFAVVSGTEGGVALGSHSLATRKSGGVGYNLTNTPWRDLNDYLIMTGQIEAYTKADAALTAAQKELAADPDNYDLQAKVAKAAAERNAIYNSWISTNGAVSIGNEATGITRQLTGVAAGTQDTDAVNVAQLKAVNTKVDKNTTDITELTTKIKNAGGVHYFSVNANESAKPEGTNWNNDGAKGVSAIAVGPHALAQGNYSTVVGPYAQAVAKESSVFGVGANASGVAATAAGAKAKAMGIASTATGSNAVANGKNASAFGSAAKATWTAATAVGSNAVADGNVASAFGAAANATGVATTALGVSAQAKSNESVAVGTYSVADREKGKIGYALGGDNSTLEKALESAGQKAKYDELTGKIAPLEDEYNGLLKAYLDAPIDSAEKKTAKEKLDAWTDGHPDFLLAVKEKQQMTDAWQSGSGAVSVGKVGATRQITNVAAGSEDTDAVNVAQLKALDNKVTDKLKDAGGVHYFSVNSDDKNAPDGTNYNNDGATGQDAVAIGRKAKAQGKYSTALGDVAKAQGNSSTALGSSAVAYENYSTALGDRAKAEGYASTAVGYEAQAQAQYSTALGHDAKAQGKSSTALGRKAKAQGDFSTALGYKAEALVDESVALGNDAVAVRKAGTVGYLASAGGTTLDDVLTALDKKTDYDNWTATINASKAEYERLIKAYFDASRSDKPAAKAALDTWKGKHKDFVDALEARARLETTWKANRGAVSVGGERVDAAGKKIITSRQITNVAAGTEDTDAVNVAQLKSLATAPMNFYFGGSKDKNNTYTPGTTNWSMSLNDFRMDFGDGLKAEQVTDKDGKKYTLVTLDKDSLKNDPNFKGPQGEKGETGAKGDKGEKGADGKDGAKGADGKDGKSAYDTWKEQKGNEGKTEKEFLEGLKGKDGVDGKDGAKGADGKDGAKGADGKDGKSAYEIWKEKPGNEGKSEDDFLKSLKGKDGKDGTGTGGASVEAGKNISVDKTDPAKSVVSLKDEITVKSVTAGGVTIKDNKITGLAPGEISKDSKDAVNGSQLFATNRMVVNNMNQINNLRDESREGDAMGAAMAALKPLDFDPYQRSQVMAGVGYYRGKEAFALGLAHYKNEDLMIHGGLAYAGNSELMANVGVSYRFGSKDDRDIKHDRNLRMPQYAEGPISSVYILQDEVERLTKENKEANDRIAALEAKLEKVLEKVK